MTTILRSAITLLLHNLKQADARLQIVGRNWVVQLGKAEQEAIKKYLEQTETRGKK
jgi:hypothetical protein